MHMDTKDSRAPASVIPRRESGVLFDDDYRKHIQNLNTKLTRERRDVVILREKIRQLEEENVNLQACVNMLREGEKKRK
jgi:hypothetical protein